MSDPEPLDFGHTYESLFLRALKPELTPSLKAQLKALGLDLDRQPLLPAYPAALWPRVLAVTASELFPDVAVDDAARTMGERFISAYFETPLGRAARMMMQALGPKRALGRVERTLRSANNYQRTRMEERGPNEVELWIGQTHGLPGWFTGMIAAVARHLGLQGTRISVKAREGDAATFLIQWE